MSYRYTPGYSQPPEPEPRYRYQVLVIWWPYKYVNDEKILDSYGKDGWRVIDVHWTGEKNEENQEKIAYHLEWTPQEKPASYTIKEQR